MRELQNCTSDPIFLLRFRDPYGMDIKFKCESEASCKDAVDKFNRRKDAEFTVKLGKGGALEVVGKVNASKLKSAAERELIGAIRDKSKSGIVNIIDNTGQFEFAVSSGKGSAQVDLGNISKLDGKSNDGGLNSGDVLAHEGLEAYFSVSMEQFAAHDKVSALFPGLDLPSNNYNHLTKGADGDQVMDFSRFSQGISDGRGSLQITITYITPIPYSSIDPRFVSSKDRAEEARIAGSRVTEVNFVAKPKEKN